MKARKMLKYLDLESEVVRIVTIYRPQPTEIKKRIELLIERDYISRDDKDQALLIYVPWYILIYIIIINYLIHI